MKHTAIWHRIRCTNTHTHLQKHTSKNKYVRRHTKTHAHSNTKDARTISCGSICLKHTHMRTVVLNTLKYKHALIHAHTCLQTHTHTHTKKHTLTQQTHDKPIKIKRISSPEAKDTSLFKEVKGGGRSPLRPIKWSWRDQTIIIITTTIIINNRPKPAYGRQGLAGCSLSASGDQLGRGSGDYSWHTHRQTLHHNIYVIVIFENQGV